MPEAPFDLAAKHPLLPHPEVTKAYKENEFKYRKNLEDRNYDAWYDEVKRSTVTILITQFFRIQRNRKDYLYYDAILFGTDRKGNRAPLTIRMGVYDAPTFHKSLDNRTDRVISNEVEQKTRTYDIPYTPELFDTLLEQTADDGQLNLIVVTPGRTYNITDPVDFRDATYSELVEIGTTGRSLHSLRAASPPKAKSH